jgi:hypothetical protein
MLVIQKIKWMEVVSKILEESLTLRLSKAVPFETGV